MFDNSDVVLRTGLVSGEDRLLGPPIDGGKPRRVAVVRQRGSVASTPPVAAWVAIGLISGNSTLEPPIDESDPGQSKGGCGVLPKDPDRAGFKVWDVLGDLVSNRRVSS